MTNTVKPSKSSASWLALDMQLCFALYSASLAMTKLYKPLLAPLGLTYPQYLVMRLLWQKGPQPVKQIAAVLQLDYGTLSPLLKRLEAAGLITRLRRRDDERSVQIELTPAGDAMRTQAENVPDRLTCAMGLDEQASRDLLHTLSDLTAAVTRATGEHPDHSPPGS